MTWLREVRHVLRKDLRQSRPLLALYLAVVAVATMHAVELPVFERAAFGPSMVVVMLIGALLTASAIQADPPARADAFWATQPFRRLAMLGAKAAFVLVVAGIASIGQLIALRSYDLTARTALWQLSGSVALFGAVLLFAMVLAGITRNLGAFMLAAIAIPIGVVITYATFDDQISRIPMRQTVAPVLGLAAAAVLVVWLYLKGDDRRLARATGFGVVALTLLSTCSTGSWAPPVEPRLASGPVPTLTLEQVALDGRRPPMGLEMALRITGIEPGTDGQVDVRDLILHARDGSTVHTSIANGNITRTSNRHGLDQVIRSIGFGGLPLADNLPRIPGVRWIGEQPNRDVRTAVMPALTTEQWRSTASGIVSVELDGSVHLWDARMEAMLPAVAGAGLTERGRRIRIAQWTPEDAVSTLVVKSSAIDTDPETDPSSRPAHMLGLALVNEQRGEGLALDRHSAGSDLDGLVLPGVAFGSERGVFGLTHVRPGVDTAPDAAWLRQARLYVYRRHYRGAYPIRLTLRLPAPMPVTPVSGIRTGVGTGTLRVFTPR